MERLALGLKTRTRRWPAVALCCMLLASVTGCAGYTQGATDQVRLVITPVPTPTPVPPAQPTAAPVTYTVKAGDTLSGIAELFGVSVDDIVRANNIADPNALAEGQVLTIPGRQPEPAETEVAGTPGTPGAETTQTPGPAGSPTLPPPDVTPPQGPDVPDPTEPVP